MLTLLSYSTGATGYIGGDVLYAVASKHPDYEITCLVRNEDKAALVAAAFPKIRFVYGTLDDADLLEKESKEADIVLSELNDDVALCTLMLAHLHFFISSRFSKRYLDRSHSLSAT
jgi:N-acetyl-gamma-glutamylphosphate reductase